MDIGDSGNNDSDNNSNKPRQSKGKNRVWDKVSWFTRKSRGSRESQSDAEFENDLNSSSVSSLSPVFSRPLSDCSSSSEGDVQFLRSLKSKNSRRSSINSQVLYQHCVKPSVVKALFRRECALYHSQKLPYIHYRKTQSLPINSQYNMPKEESVDIDMESIQKEEEGSLDDICHCPSCCSCRQSSSENNFGSWPRKRSCPLKTSLTLSQARSFPKKKKVPTAPLSQKALTRSHNQELNSWQSTCLSNRLSRKRPSNSCNRLEIQDCNYSRYEEHMNKSRSLPSGTTLVNLLKEFEKLEKQNCGLLFVNGSAKDKRRSQELAQQNYRSLFANGSAEDRKRSQELAQQNYGSLFANGSAEDRKHAQELEQQNHGSLFVNGSADYKNHSQTSDFTQYPDFKAVECSKSSCNGMKRNSYRNKFVEYNTAKSDTESNKHVCLSRRVAVAKQKESNKGIDAKVFRDRMEMSMNWFQEFNDQQKNCMMKRLLELCELPQMHMLSVLMEPILHQTCPHNCQDLLSWLPAQLSLHVLSFLDPVSLSACCQVSKVWYELTTYPYIWQRLCRLPKWQLSRAEEHKQMINHMSSTIGWKAVFSERYRLRRNWLKGLCSVRTFEGHTEGISCVQFDDTRIVSGSTDSTIKVWNIRTNTPWSVQTLVGHSGTVRCLHLEGNRLVSGSTDRSIKVWDLSMHSRWSSIACRKTMIGHQQTVRCLQVDDEKVVSGSYDETLKVWDIRSGDCRLTLRGHTAAVLCLQFDESKIISGSADKTIKIWNLSTGVCVMSLEGHHDAVTCLQFDLNKIVSGSLDCNIKFWDIHLGNCTSTLDWAHGEGHTGVVRCLQIDRWRVVSAADDKTLKVWNIETGERLVTLRNHTDGVTCLQFNDSKIVSGSYDRTVKLWDFSSV